MQMPGRSVIEEGYRFGFNGMEKDDEVKGDGNTYTTLNREYDPCLGRWASVDPEDRKTPDQSPYCSTSNDPIHNTDPNGDFVLIDNLIGGAVGAIVDYGFQVAGNIAGNGWHTEAFTDVDKTSIAVSFGAGFLTDGLSSAKIIAKGVTTGVTKAGVIQVAKYEAVKLTVNTAASVARQANDAVKGGKNLKAAVASVSWQAAVKEGAITTVLSNAVSYIPGGKKMATAEKDAEQKLLKYKKNPSVNRLAATKYAEKAKTKLATTQETGKNIAEKATENLVIHKQILTKKEVSNGK